MREPKRWKQSSEIKANPKGQGQKQGRHFCFQEYQRFGEACMLTKRDHLPTAGDRGAKSVSQKVDLHPVELVGRVPERHQGTNVRVFLCPEFTLVDGAKEWAKNTPYN